MSSYLGCKRLLGGDEETKRAFPLGERDFTASEVLKWSFLKQIEESESLYLTQEQ
jgi:hypothetical protein